MRIKYLLAVYCLYLIIFSLVSFFMFLNDKKRAKKGLTRIKEKHLLLSAVLGGAIGAFFGRIVGRHKTEKIYFSLVIYLALICEAFVFLLMTYIFLEG